MSRMADLHITIVTELETQSHDFAKAIACGCNSCENYTMAEIDKAFKSMSALFVVKS